MPFHQLTTLTESLFVKLRTNFWLIFLFCLCPLSGLIANEDLSDIPSVGSLYRSYIEANGGFLNIESLSSIAIKGQRKDKEGDTTGISIYRKRSDKLRIRKDRKNYFEELVYNGREGWREISSLEGYQIELKKMQPDEMVRASKMCRMEGPFFSVGRNEKYITSIELDEVAGNPAYRVEVNPESGLPFTAVWIDPNHFHEVKISQVTERDGDPVLMEIYFEELTYVEGHAFHLKQTVYADGVLESTLAVDSVRVNAGIYDKFFSVNGKSADGGLN